MTRRWHIALFIGEFFLLGFITVLAAMQWHQQQALDSPASETRSLSTDLHEQGKRLDDIDWAQQFFQHQQALDLVTIEVGTIQFLKRGFSLEIDSSSVSQNGLAIEGSIGNPFALELTNLTVTFIAGRSYTDARDSYLKIRRQPDKTYFSPGQSFVFFPSEMWHELGRAQSLIRDIAPGQRGAFKLTIPGVRQASENLEVAVSFSGERYSYPLAH